MAVHHPGDLAQEFGYLNNQIKQLVMQTFQNSSFGSAGLRVHSGGWIVIENGGLSVVGTAQVSGRLEGDGTLDWDGPWLLNGTGRITGDTTGTGRLTWEGAWSLDGNGEITGNVSITGDTDFLGDVTIRKTLDVMATTRLRGKTTLEDDLVVTSSGKIIVGDMTIDPAGNGSVKFANGAQVTSGSGGVSLIHNTASVRVTSDGVSLSYGGTGMGIGGGGVYINPISLPAHYEPDVPAGTLWASSDGTIHRTYK